MVQGQGRKDRSDTEQRPNITKTNKYIQIIKKKITKSSGVLLFAMQ